MYWEGREKNEVECGMGRLLASAIMTRRFSRIKPPSYYGSITNSGLKALCPMRVVADFDPTEVGVKTCEVVPYSLLTFV